MSDMHNKILELVKERKQYMVRSNRLMVLIDSLVDTLESIITIDECLDTDAEFRVKEVQKIALKSLNTVDKYLTTIDKEMEKIK